MEETTENSMVGESSTETTSTTKEVMAAHTSTEKPMSEQNKTVETKANVTASANVTNSTETVEEDGPSSILYPGKSV